MKNKDLKILLQFIKPYKKNIFIVFFSLFLTSISILFFGKLVKIAIDIDSYNKIDFNILIILFSILSLIVAIAGYFRSVIINITAQRIISDIRIKLYNNLLIQDIKFFQKNKIGDVIAIIMEDLNVIYNIISNSISFATRNLILFIGSFISLFFISYKLSLTILFIVISIIFIIFLIIKRLKILNKKSNDILSDMNSNIIESYNIIKIIKIYNAKSFFVDKLKSKIIDFFQFFDQKIKLRSFLISFSLFCALLIIGLILIMGKIEINNSNLTNGELSSFIYYCIILVISIISLIQSLISFQNIFTIIDKIKYLIDFNILSKNNNKIINKDIDKIFISDISIKYEGEYIIKNFSAIFKKNTINAIIGESGIGKTSLLNTILKFTNYEGKIYFNDIDIDNMDLNNIYENISYISSQNLLFDDNIINNISFNKDIDKDFILNIIKKYPIFDFIKDLNININKLSAGEKQRIALLRAIIKDSPILLFDEAESNLDSKNRKLFIDLINDIKINKIIINITHDKVNYPYYDDIIELT